MSLLDRRELLQKLAWSGAVVGAGGIVTPLVPSSALGGAGQATPTRAGVPRTAHARAALAHGIVPLSGETAMDLYHSHPHLEKEEVVQPEDIRLQTRLVMRNLKEVLDWLGLGWKHVARLTRYQTRLDESKQIDEVLASYFRDSRPPINVYAVDGLSSPQARVEIDLWVIAEPGIEKYVTPGPVRGIGSVFPRPEFTIRQGYAPGVFVDRSMDLVFLSGLTAYPFDVDPWNPGSFSVPSDPAERAKLATANLQRVLDAAGITWQHLIFRVSYTAPGGGGIPFQEKQGDWRSCSTSLRVTDTGVPGVNVLYQMTAAAPRKASLGSGRMRGVAPLLFEPGMSLSPAIRVSSDVDLVFFSGITAYPAEVDPWNPGGFALPVDPVAQEKLLGDNVERTLKGAGLGWRNIVLLARTGIHAGRSSMTERMGDWRPCRTTRAVPSGVPGAHVVCDITAVAPRTA